MEQKFRNSIVNKSLAYIKRNHRLPNTLRITPQDAKRAQDGGLFFQYAFRNKGKKYIGGIDSKIIFVNDPFFEMMLPKPSLQILYHVLQWNFKDKGKPEIKNMKYPMSTLKYKILASRFIKGIK